MIFEKAQPPTEAEPLDDALARLVDATMRNDREGALAALLDAVAHGLAGARLAAEVWAARECLAAADLDDDLDEEEDLSGHPT